MIKAVYLNIDLTINALRELKYILLRLEQSSVFIRKIAIYGKNWFWISKSEESEVARGVYPAKSKMVKIHFCVNFLGHNEQLNGVSPVWTLM